MSGEPRSLRFSQEVLRVGMPDEGRNSASPSSSEGPVSGASQGLDVRLSPGPDENDPSLDPDVRRWLRLREFLFSLDLILEGELTTDVVVELLELVAAEGIRGLGPLLVVVESFASLEKDEPEGGDAVDAQTPTLSYAVVASTTLKIALFARRLACTTILIAAFDLGLVFGWRAPFVVPTSFAGSLAVLKVCASSSPVVVGDMTVSCSMSSERVENMSALARMGDPFTLDLVKLILSAPVPGTADEPWTVVSRCTEVVAALEAFTVYLHPYPFGHLHQYSNLPGMDGEQTWMSLVRWFRGLHIWSGTFVGSNSLPQALTTACWVDKMLTSVFDLVYVFLQHYPLSPVARILRLSADFRRLCIQYLYGALLVSESSLASVVAVVAHPFWKSSSFERDRVRPTLEGLFVVRPPLGFLREALGRFVRLLLGESVLDNSAELHALALIVVQMHEYMDLSLCSFNAARWFSRCMRTVLALLEGVDTRSTTLLVALELDVLGRLLSLCFRVVHPIVAMQEGSGWVLDALKAGLLRAVMDIVAYVSVEKARARHTRTVDHSSSLLKKCDDLLVSLIPHLLTPSILRLVRKQMLKHDPRRLRVLEGWAAWCEEVAMVYEVRFGYKCTSYSEASLRLCSYGSCEGNSVVATRLAEDVPMSTGYSRLCGGCSRVAYCSNRCRRSHWKESHSKDCVYTGAARKSGEAFLLRFDVGFLRTFAHTFLQSRITALALFRLTMSPQDVLVLDLSDYFGDVRVDLRETWVGRVGFRVPPEGYEDGDLVVVACGRQRVYFCTWLSPGSREPPFIYD
ncbi:hypothetical protein VNI00_015234 [Paramarasmius palmivorus]|uniref:MYND-type domain-containing protein n=1 Tax=Paramarasmius palmivorus TaxID=297713 RepID=A0AAW0BMU1_9AGAR